MNAFLRKIFGLGFINDWIEAINGNKTVTGVLSILLYVLNAIPIVFEDAGFSLSLAESINKILLYLGITLTPIGLAHKAVKANK